MKERAIVFASAWIFIGMALWGSLCPLFYSLGLRYTPFVVWSILGGIGCYYFNEKEDLEE